MNAWSNADLVEMLFELESDITSDSASYHLIQILNCAEEQCYGEPKHISTNIAVIILNFNQMAKLFNFLPENNPGFCDRYRKIREETLRDIEAKIESSGAEDRKYWTRVKMANEKIMTWDQASQPEQGSFH